MVQICSEDVSELVFMSISDFLDVLQGGRSV